MCRRSERPKGAVSWNSMERSLSSPLWLFNPASVRSEIAPGKDANARPGIMRYKSWPVNYRGCSTKDTGAADVCGKKIEHLNFQAE